MNENIRKILMGGLMAAAGAAVTYFLSNIDALNIPPMLLPAITAFAGFLVNALRKSGPLLIDPPRTPDRPVVIPDPGPNETSDRPIKDLFRRLIDALTAEGRYAAAKEAIDLCECHTKDGAT